MATRRMIEKWEAADGTLWDTPEKADAHDVNQAKREEILALLPIPDDDPGCVFANGGYSLSVDPEKYGRAVALFWEAVRPELDRYSPDLYDRLHPHINGWVGRYLDDFGSPFYGVWSTLNCVNTTLWRLYGQQYYALHPDEVKENR